MPTRIALLLVAPCTANVIGKFANGIADDFLTSLYLATKAPVLLAPAMNTNMLAHPAVQRNLQTLTARGVRFVEPGEGYLACGWIGKGRLAEPAEIVAAAEHAARVRAASALRGRAVLVTAGPDLRGHRPRALRRQPLERPHGFRAGRRGAPARRARDAGRRTDRVEPPAVDELVRVRSAAEMHEAVMRARGRAPTS